jgi:hypothetical protein
VTKKIFIIGAILIGALITIHGCYTIIKHPSVMQADNTGETTEHANGNRDCVSCHQDYQQYPYGYYYGYYPGYYRDYSRWGQYYAYPWWWDYYYSGRNDEGGNGENHGGQVEPQGSKPGIRRGLEPPYAFPNSFPRDTLSPPSFNTGTNNPPVIVTPGGGTATGGTVTNPPDKPKEPAKVEDKKPPKRRGEK